MSAALEAGVKFSLLLLVMLTELWGCGGRTPASDAADTVVLLHGLGRTDRSMIPLKHALAEQGYRVVSVRYPSTQRSIEALARDELRVALEACCSDSEGTVHFVTHSMGGIVLRYYLENHERDRLGRVVMLSPPNQGSELADWVSESPTLRKLLGASAAELGTDSASVPNQIGPADFELGIITGNRSLNPLYSWMIPGPDDGKVAVERAKVTGMTDFLVVPHSHSFIMLREPVIEQVIYFLEHAHFFRTADDPLAEDSLSLST